jgi:hypothetical protein
MSILNFTITRVSRIPRVPRDPGLVLAKNDAGHSENSETVRLRFAGEAFSLTDCDGSLPIMDIKLQFCPY